MVKSSLHYHFHTPEGIFLQYRNSLSYNEHSGHNWKEIYGMEILEDKIKCFFKTLCLLYNFQFVLARKSQFTIFFHFLRIRSLIQSKIQVSDIRKQSNYSKFKEKYEWCLHVYRQPALQLLLINRLSDTRDESQMILNLKRNTIDVCMCIDNQPFSCY